MSAENAGKPLRNAKHEAVALAYFADPERVGWRCYASVYANSSEAAAKTAFSRLLKNADFTARLAALSAGVAEKVSISVESVIAELAKIGFANMQDYMSVGLDGQPTLDWSRLTRDQAAALSEVTVETVVERGDEGAPAKSKAKQPDDDAETVRRVKFKLYDKRAALVDIGKHLGAFTQKVELTGKDGGPIETKEVEMSELELARRIAFALEQGARAAPALRVAAKETLKADAKPTKKGRKR